MKPFRKQPCRAKLLEGEGQTKSEHTKAESRWGPLSRFSMGLLRTIIPWALIPDGRKKRKNPKNAKKNSAAGLAPSTCRARPACTQERVRDSACTRTLRILPACRRSGLATDPPNVQGAPQDLASIAHYAPPAAPTSAHPALFSCVDAEKAILIFSEQQTAGCVKIHRLHICLYGVALHQLLSSCTRSRDKTAR